MTTKIKTVTIWTALINTPSFNNPNFRLSVASQKRPTFEQIKVLWDEYNHGAPLGQPSDKTGGYKLYGVECQHYRCLDE